MHRLTEELANPVWNNALATQSPELSPVNIRPVLFPPWAAGASPIINNLAFASPKLGSGLAQYRSFTNRFGIFDDICAIFSDNLGHILHIVALELISKSFSFESWFPTLESINLDTLFS